MSTAIERLLATAKAEEGYLEKETNSNLDNPTANAGDNNWNKYARDLDALGVYNGKKNGYHWCDIFVDWCFIHTFGLEAAMKLTRQPMGGYGAGCTYSARYYKDHGQFHQSGPKPGDQIFFTNDGGKTMAHTGIVVSVANGRVYTVEGNTSSAAGMVANGGCVRAKSYALTYNRIGGYGRPDYSIVEEEEEMTQQDWDKMMENWLSRRADLPPSNWSEADRVWAEESGIIAGDTSGRKQYMVFPTREQIMVFLHRFYELMTQHGH